MGGVTWLVALATGAAAMWSQIRAWGGVLLSVVWVRTEIEHPGYVFLLRYLRESEEFQVGRLGQQMFSAMHDYMRPAGRREWSKDDSRLNRGNGSVGGRSSPR